MDKVDDGKYILSFSAWNTFAIRKKFTAFVVNIVSVLNAERGTSSKGLNA